MAKKYINKAEGTDPIVKSRNILIAAPYDVRSVVETYDDLFNKATFVFNELYVGMLVITYDTQDVYVLSKLPGSRDNEIKWAENIKWKKVGGDSVDIDLSEYAKLTDLDKYATKDNLLNFLTASDVEDFVSVNDVVNLTSGFVSQSDLDVYVKTEALVDFVKSTDIKDFVKKEDLNDFLTSSDVSDFVKVDELNAILSEEVFGKFVSKSDLDVYVKTEDILDFVTSSELDARIAAINIPEVPTNVSAFTNDAGYLTKNDLPDFLTASDVEDFVSVEELKNYVTKADITNFVSQSDLDVYVKTEDVVKKLENYATKADITNFLTANDVKDFVKVGDIADVVRTDELKQYVKTSDVVDFLTASDITDVVRTKDITDVVRTKDIADFIKESELPDFLLASDLDGYVKTEDLKGYIPTTELERLASKSDLNGYVKTSDAIAYLTASDLEGFATLDKIPTAGSFPAASNIDSSVAPVNGYATVQGVMDYVNALLEKKKDELTDPDYIYVNGVKIEDLNNLPTPTSIYQMNQYEIDKDILTNGLQVLVNKEILGFDGENDPTSQSIAYSVIFSVNIPTNYSIEIHNWDPEANRWSNAHQLMVPNPRYSTTQYGSRTYNCFVRPTNGDNYYDAVNAIAKYKIVIKKNQ